jgi:5'-deoxynucleotidase YfbR-like HD superfamily hydrolase
MKSSPSLSSVPPHSNIPAGLFEDLPENNLSLTAQPEPGDRIGKPRERLLAHVKRWGIVPTIRVQNVADHSYFVALMAPRVAAMIQWDAGNQGYYYLTRWALLHDSPEQFSSDIPTPVKKRLNVKAMEEALAEHTHLEYQKMSALVARGVQPWVDIVNIVKFVDSLEACQFLVEEAMLGNRAVSDVLKLIRERTFQDYKSLPWGKYVTAEKKTDLWESEISPLIDNRSRQWPVID